MNERANKLVIRYSPADLTPDTLVDLAPANSPANSRKIRRQTQTRRKLYNGKTS